MGTFLCIEQELQHRVEVLERQVADLQRAPANDKTGERQLTIPDVSVSLPSKDEACAEGYRIANDAGYNYRRVLREPDHDIYYSGWMDCFDWISKGNEH